MAAPGAKGQVLSGWKEIASYLRKGVRTCQRYEREMRLPIHRPAGKSSAAVVALPAELEEWIINGARAIDSRPKRRALNIQTNRLRANFLQIDSEIALTFCNIALQTRDREKRGRAAETARKAYETIVQMSEDTDLSEAARHKLEANLQRLRVDLESLGQRL